MGWDGIATLTLNRPEVLNSINTVMIAEIRDAVKEVAADGNARLLLITGEGQAFCAGADLAAPGKRAEGMSVGEGVAHGMKIGFNPMMSELYALEKPIISAVNGTTAGGGVGLVLVADICIAITGDKIPAETAAEWGLIWKCVADAELMSTVHELAQKIAKGPSNAFSEIRKAIDIAPHKSYDDQLEYERVTQGQLGDHPNFAEGVKAFLTKREAKFK